jgi:HSP20 family protein
MFDWSRDFQQTLDQFRRSVDQMFEGFFGSPWTPTARVENTNWAFTPVVETGWTDDYLNLRAVLPGVSEKDVKVSVTGNQLVIEGERKAPENFATSGGGTRLFYGKFYRAIDLPNGLDLEKVNCRLHDGVLDISIPLTAAMKPKHIPIQVEAGEQRKAIAA